MSPRLTRDACSIKFNSYQIDDDDVLLPAWDRLIAHTQDHFDREDRWMTDTSFSATHCHTTQHKVVLQVMREGARRGLEGDLALVRRMASELALWFPQHAQSMDAALALHVRRVGYDPDTGSVAEPHAPSAACEAC